MADKPLTQESSNGKPEQVIDLTPERGRERIIVLVILLLVAIAGFAALFYKLDHPAAMQMFQNHSS